MRIIETHSIHNACLMLPVVLGSAAWFGYEVVTFLARNKWDVLTRVASGFPIGFIYQAFLALVAQYYIEWGNVHLFVVLGIMVAVSMVLHVVNAGFHPAARIRLKVVDVVVLVCSAMFVTYRLCLIYFDGGEFTRGAAYSDFSFHTQLIASFAVGCNVKRSSMFGFETVMSVGNALAYPVFVNFHAAFLISDCGVSWPSAMRWSALCVGVCFVVLMWALTLRFTDGDSWATACALPLWMFSGGLGFLDVFAHGIDWQARSMNYIHTFYNGKAVFWFQSMTHIFHPQRSATFALPLCYIAINALLTGISKFEWRFFVLAAIAVGVTPQTQVHAYVGLALFAIVLAVVTFPFNRKWLLAAKCWAIFGVVANVIALPLCVPYLDRTADGHDFFDFRPIWQDKRYTTAKHFAFLDVWWRALGVFGMIALIFGYAVCTWRQIQIYSAAMFVFLVSSIIMFQPWELDNCKVFQDGWMPLAIGFVGQYFSKTWRRSSSRVIKSILCVLFFSCIASGLLNLLTYESYSGILYGYDDAVTGQWVAENTSPDAIYHGPNEVLIPSASYGGRRLFYGFRGWISSHGLMNSTRNMLVGSFDSGDDPEAAAKNNITYLINFHVANTQDTNIEKEWWELVFEFGRYKIWRLNWNPRPVDPEPPKRKPRRKRK